MYGNHIQMYSDISLSSSKDEHKRKESQAFGCLKFEMPTYH